MFSIITTVVQGSPMQIVNYYSVRFRTSQESGTLLKTNDLSFHLKSGQRGQKHVEVQFGNAPGQNMWINSQDKDIEWHTLQVYKPIDQSMVCSSCHNCVVDTTEWRQALLQLAALPDEMHQAVQTALVWCSLLLGAAGHFGTDRYFIFANMTRHLPNTFVLENTCVWYTLEIPFSMFWIVWISTNWFLISHVWLKCPTYSKWAC